MSETLVLLQIEHRNFVRVLDVLDDLADAFERGEDTDVELLQQVMAYFLGYPDACHHPKEDLVFRRLRAVAPAVADRIYDVVDDHEGLAARTLEAARRARAATGAADPALADVLREFSATYREHLRLEEELFFPTARERLGRDDWDAIDFGLFDGQDPLFDPLAEDRYRRLRHVILAKRPPRSMQGEV